MTSREQFDEALKNLKNDKAKALATAAYVLLYNDKPYVKFRNTTHGYLEILTEDCGIKIADLPYE